MRNLGLIPYPVVNLSIISYPLKYFWKINIDFLKSLREDFVYSLMIIKSAEVQIMYPVRLSLKTIKVKIKILKVTQMLLKLTYNYITIRDGTRKKSRGMYKRKCRLWKQIMHCNTNGWSIKMNLRKQISDQKYPRHITHNLIFTSSISVFRNTSELCADCVWVSTKIRISWRLHLSWGRRGKFRKEVGYFASNGLYKMFFALKWLLIFIEL